MYLEFLQFWARETGANISRNRLMSLLAITTVTVGLFILGSFYLTVSNLRAAVTEQTHKLDLIVLLDKDVSPRRRKQIFDAARMPQVASVKVVLGSQVLSEWQKTFSDMPLDDMKGTNAFADELRIKLKNPEDLFKVRAYLTHIKGVQAARDTSEADQAARQLLAFNRFLTLAALVSLMVLTLAILLIIHNAIRLTVFARRREIRIMHLVGATTGFIRVPFLLEGLFYGLVGALVASGALSPLYLLASGSPAPFVRSLLPLQPQSLLLSCVSLMVAAGLLFGLVGSWFSFNHSQRRRLV
jgi:cell division transport system permease protein